MDQIAVNSLIIKAVYGIDSCIYRLCMLIIFNKHLLVCKMRRHALSLAKRCNSVNLNNSIICQVYESTQNWTDFKDITLTRDVLSLHRQ